MRLPQSLQTKKLILLAIIVFTAALSLRLYHLDSQTLECDEFYTIPAATGHQYVYLSHEGDTFLNKVPISTTEYRGLMSTQPGFGLSAVTSVLKRNVHLPAYFYFMHYWIELFGTSEFALRLPSVIFGALASLMLVLLGAELFGPFAGGIAGLLMALSPEQIYFSQQARMYSLLGLLAISSIYLLILLSKSRPSTWLYWGYAILSIVGLYTHYEYAFCLLAQVGFVWVVSNLGKQHYRYWLATHLAIAIAFLPCAVITVSQKANSPEIVAWVQGSLSGNLILTEVVTKIANLISVPELPLGWLSVIVAYALVIYGAVVIRSQRSLLLLILFWILMPVLGIVLMDKVLGTRAVTISRYWLMAGPPLYLLMSVGVDRLRNTSIKIVLSAVLVGFMFSAALLTAQGSLRPKPDRHKDMAQYVDSQVRGSRNQVVLSEGLNSLPLALAYYGRQNFEVLRFKWVADQLAQRRFVDVIGNRAQVLLLVSGQSQATKLLSENGYRLEGQPVLFGHVNILRFVKR